MRQRQDTLQCQVELAGVLARHVPTRLVDISSSGCLLESSRRIDEGTVGALRLEISGETYFEDVRTTRCVAIAGLGSSFLVGIEFIGPARTDGTSIRRAMSSSLRGLMTGKPAFWAR